MNGHKVFARMSLVLGLVLLTTILIVASPVPTYAQSPVKIMPIGDSITEGSDGNGYRKPLHAALTADGFDIDFVGSLEDGDFGDIQHEGHWGETADWFLEGTPSKIYGWASVYQPDIVLIHLGTNDIRHGEGVDSTINDLGLLIDELRSVNPEITILLAQIIPWDGELNIRACASLEQ